MFERLTQSIDRFFAIDKDDRHDSYLASSCDLADLERRMRQVEQEDHAYGQYYCGSLTTRRRDDLSL